MADKTDEELFDLRTVERNIEKGLITREDYKEYLENLPDAADNIEVFEAEFEEGVLEDDEEEEAEEAEEADEE
jgi:hypothetical protein